MQSAPANIQTLEGPMRQLCRNDFLSDQASPRTGIPICPSWFTVCQSRYSRILDQWQRPFCLRCSAMSFFHCLYLETPLHPDGRFRTYPAIQTGWHVGRIYIGIFLPVQRHRHAIDRGMGPVQAISMYLIYGNSTHCQTTVTNVPIATCLVPVR